MIKCIRCEDWRNMGLSSYCPEHDLTETKKEIEKIDVFFHEKTPDWVGTRFFDREVDGRNWTFVVRTDFQMKVEYVEYNIKEEFMKMDELPLDDPNIWEINVLKSTTLVGLDYWEGSDDEIFDHVRMNYPHVLQLEE